MSKHAFVLGAGQIGTAVAMELLEAGYTVTLARRSGAAPPLALAGHVTTATLDREEAGALARSLGGGADLFVDTVAFDVGHARQLLEASSGIGQIAVTSSASVYCDEAGRSLDGFAETSFPELPDPIPETQRAVAPGPATYATRKRALEEHLLQHATIPVAILRPCAIYGVGSRHPREWWFVKRMREGRTAIPLARNGKSRFHPTASRNIARLIRVLADSNHSEAHVLNIADPSTPTVLEIGRAIAAHLGYSGRLLPLDGPPSAAHVGLTPWSVPRPFALDCAAAATLGYTPATDYASAVGAACDALTAPLGSWKQAYPQLAGYPWDLFDYASEDAVFAVR